MFSRFPEQEPHHQMHFNVIPQTTIIWWWGGGSYSSAGDTVSVF